VSLRLCGLVACAALASACPGSIEDPARFRDATVGLDAPPGDASAPDATVGLDAPSACVDYVERTLLPETCATAYCHGAAKAAASLDLESPGLARRLVGVRGSMGCRSVALVDPLRPEASLMVAKLRATPGCGARMPLAGTPLTAAQLECVRAWAEGLAGSLAADAGADR
jgi:hypothetical protein